VEAWSECSFAAVCSHYTFTASFHKKGQGMLVALAYENENLHGGKI